MPRSTQSTSSETNNPQIYILRILFSFVHFILVGGFWLYSHIYYTYYVCREFLLYTVNPRKSIYIYIYVNQPHKESVASFRHDTKTSDQTIKQPPARNETTAAKNCSAPLLWTKLRRLSVRACFAPTATGRNAIAQKYVYKTHKSHTKHATHPALINTQSTKHYRVSCATCI